MSSSEEKLFVDLRDVPLAKYVSSNIQNLDIQTYVRKKGSINFIQYSGFACIGTPKFDLFLAIVEREFNQFKFCELTKQVRTPAVTL